MAGGLVAGLRHVLFLILLHARAPVRLLLKVAGAGGALFLVLGFFLRPGFPTAAYVWAGVAAIGGAVMAWQYDTLLEQLAPNGRGLILDL